MTHEDLEIPLYGVILRRVTSQGPDHCDWWIMRGGCEEPWPEWELELA